MRCSISILMCALESRRPIRARLEASLRRQCAGRDAELLIEEDDGRTPSGAKRNALTARARGSHIAFVDDDDAVAYNYVEALLSACAAADVVTFDLTYMRPDAGPQVWSFGTRHLDRTRLPHNKIGMSANHLCAWRREVAAAVPWVPTLSYMDDVVWYRGVMASRLAKSEAHVDQSLYIYRWHPATTANQTRDRIRQTHEWAAGGVNYYRVPSGVAVDARGMSHQPGPERQVVFPGGAVVTMPVSSLPRPLCTFNSKAKNQ